MYYKDLFYTSLFGEWLYILNLLQIIVYKSQKNAYN